MKYRVEINARSDQSDDTWTGNRVVYDTDKEALRGAVDLYGRWMMVRYYRVIDEDGTVHHTNKPEAA
jgi:hypothetical protein